MHEITSLEGIPALAAYYIPDMDAHGDIAGFIIILILIIIIITDSAGQARPTLPGRDFLDLDRFKLVNDHFGHEVGDDLLTAVAQKLQELVRESDTVAPLGGDEFVIVLDNPAHRDEVEHIAHRIIAGINEPMELRGKTAQVGTSIGWRPQNPNIWSKSWGGHVPTCALLRGHRNVPTLHFLHHAGPLKASKILN